MRFRPRNVFPQPLQATESAPNMYWALAPATHAQKQKARLHTGPFPIQASYRLDGGGVVGCAGIGVVVGCGAVLAGCTPGTVGALFTLPFAASVRLMP